MVEYLDMIKDRRAESNREVQRWALLHSLDRVISLNEITASSTSYTCELLSFAKSSSSSSLKPGFSVSKDEDELQ